MNSSSQSLRNNISAADLRRAAEIKDNIESLEAELNNILSTNGLSTSTAFSSTSGSGGKYKISAVGLARIRAAQKARWATFRANNNKGKGKTTAPTRAPKRRMSPAARAKIAAIARARWRKARAAGRNAL